MPDRMSLVLDSMIIAVDEGFSYDGIVSIPETGLEDAGGYRFSLADWFDDTVDRLRAVISGVADRFLRSETHGNRSSSNSGIRLITLQCPPSHQDSPSSQGPSPQGRHPQDPLSLHGSPSLQDSPSPQDVLAPQDAAAPQDASALLQSLQESRKESEQVLEDIVHSDVDQNIPMSKDEEAAPPTDIDQRLTRKDRQPRLAREEKVPGDREKDFGQEKQPRKRDGDEERTGGGSGWGA